MEYDTASDTQTLHLYKMERFNSNDFQMLKFPTKCSILDAVKVLDPLMPKTKRAKQDTYGKQSFFYVT